MPQNFRCLHLGAWIVKRRYVSLLGLHNHHHKPGGLKQKKFIFLVLEARSPTSRCPQGRTPSEGQRGGSFFVSSSFWRFQVSLACGCVTPMSAFILTRPPPLLHPVSPHHLLRAPVTGFRSHPKDGGHHLYLITSAKTLFPNKAMF